MIALAQRMRLTRLQAPRAKPNAQARKQDVREPLRPRSAACNAANRRLDLQLIESMRITTGILTELLLTGDGVGVLRGDMFRVDEVDMWERWVLECM